MEVEHISRKKIYYVFNGRFPSEKAHALYAAKVCESFSDLGLDVSLIVPRRYLNTRLNYPDFYNIKNNFNVVYLPTIDLYELKIPTKLAFLVNYFCFTISVATYFLFVRSHVTVFSAEVVSSFILSLLGKKVVYEMHDYPIKSEWFFIRLFNSVDKILTQNEWKKRKLIEQFNLNTEKIVIEPNGVDLADFKIFTREEARNKLNLSQDEFIILYTGNLFDWKGADVLGEAAQYLDDNNKIFFVGGSANDVLLFKEKYKDITNINIIGFRPHQEIPYWQAAADCLVLPNTAKQDISKYHTSPMKLFEYMASNRPIVTSDLPSIRAIVNESTVNFFIPDDSKDLADTILEIKNSNLDTKPVLALEEVKKYTWSNRAIRLKNIM